jgi:outer membrane protein TolC
LQIPLRTGGNISLGLPISESETNNEFATLNPSWTTDAELSFSQPLLRNAGFMVNERQIYVASYNYLSTEARTKLDTIRVLTNVDRAYWRLYAARQALVVRKKEYDLAVDQFERAKRQVDAGVVAEVEVIRAESGVADTREQIINAETLVRNSERDLKVIMNQAGLEVEGDAVIVPTTTPHTMFFRVNPEELITQALAQRMEMLEQELAILQDAVDVGFARNQLLPLVALTYSYGVPGLGGSFNDAIAMVGDNDFNNHRVGLQVEVPIGNEAAKSALRRALLVRMQNLLTRDQRALAIKQETLTAIDSLNTNWYRIVAARKRVDAAARVYEAEVRQFSQGLRTSTDVTIAQNNLASAALSELASIADYQIAQTDIAQATGTVLGQTRVAWTPATQPAAKYFDK